ncbi:MAG: sugar nucleotide-binding protein, partial [Polyangiaceae bacterium]
MKLAVIGASGLVGAELFTRANERGVEVVGAARHVRGSATHVVDLADQKSIAAFVESVAPTHVVVGSAWPYVDGCEADPARSHRDNVETVANLLAVVRASTKVVFYSTDHVFDGTKDGPYVESDATNPLSIYAKHKLETERLLLTRGN